MRPQSGQYGRRLANYVDSTRAVEPVSKVDPLQGSEGQYRGPWEGALTAPMPLEDGWWRSGKMCDERRAAFLLSLYALGLHGWPGFIVCRGLSSAVASKLKISLGRWAGRRRAEERRCEGGIAEATMA